MRNILLSIVAVVAVLLIGLFGYASTMPDTYRVERSVKMAASPADVFPYVNDYRKWATWNPWKDIDPAMKTAYSENPAGPGAWTTWEGNSDAGKGKMTIKESVPDQKVVHDLHFIEPFEDQAVVTFSMAASADQTQFTWTMEGHYNLISKVMCIFSSMDAMIGPDFERGFKTLKPLAEKDATDRIAAEKAAMEAAAAAPPPPVDGAAATTPPTDAPPANK